MSGSLDRRGGRAGERAGHPYPRTARVNALLLEVLADSLERVSDKDEQLGLLTVTGVVTDPDLRHATVYFASLDKPAAEALERHRGALQAAIGRHVRMKRTPALRFLPDPAVAAGERVERALRRIRQAED